MSDSSGPSSYSPLGDYDPPSQLFFSEPSPKYAKLSPNFVFTPTDVFSKLQLCSTSSAVSEESEGVEEETFAKLMRDYAFKTRYGSDDSEESKVFDFDSNMISEDEKKRLRNTEAARRCREKIKKRTDELEEELMERSRKNEAMDQQRLRLLSQVGEQMRMLELLRTRNPSAGPSIIQESRMIVDKYKDAVKTKRKAIAEYHANLRSF